MSDFLLDPTVTFLNHGSFGACPRPVLDAQTRWRERLESQPVRFLIRELEAHLGAARSRVAALIGASPADLVFVRNATSGVNAVLSSLTLGPGDRILTTDHRYEAVGNTLRHAARRTGAALDVVEIPFPLSDPGIITQRLLDAITPNTRLLVLDHISSMTALVMPVAEIAAAARQRGCMVLVDGAHAPGHIDVSLSDMGADFWVGNLHKWPCAPKGSAVLWAARERHSLLHPPVISLRYGEGIQREFDWCGTDDPTPWLASTAALDHHESLGGAAFRAANLALSQAASEVLCDHLDLEPGAGDPALRCAMAAMLLPATSDDADRIYRGLLAADIECFVLPWKDRALLRISAFSAYNHIDQYQHLARALAGLLR
jgi:isopenicillin-N epimerase